MALKKVTRKEFEKFLKEYEGQVTKSHDAGQTAIDTYKADGSDGDGVIARADLYDGGDSSEYFIEE